MKYNPHLDSLRAIAALLVIALHYEILPWGWVGVQFFFVLSGFLITSIILNERKQPKSVSRLAFFKKFYIRRSQRLMPLYFGFVVVLMVGYFVTRQPKYLGAEWPYLFTYTLNFRWLFNSYSFHSFYGHLWSLALEWQFYLIWPFFIWRIPFHRIKKVLIVLLFSAIAIRAIVYFLCSYIPFFVSFHGTEDQKALPNYVLPFSHIDAFVVGGLLYFEDVRNFLSRRVVLLTVCLVMISLGLLYVYLIPGKLYTLGSLGWPTKLPGGGQWLWGYSALNIASACIIAAVLTEKKYLLVFTKSKLLQYLGKISYGIYVFHSPIVFIVHGLISNVFFGLPIVVLATIFLAHLSFNYWEKLFLNRGDKQSNNKAPRLRAYLRFYQK